MDYRIIHRGQFAVTGKRLRVSTKDGEDFAASPSFGRLHTQTAPWLRCVPTASCWASV